MKSDEISFISRLPKIVEIAEDVRQMVYLFSQFSSNITDDFQVCRIYKKNAALAIVRYAGPHLTQ